jgi:hypothetical protein
MSDGALSTSCYNAPLQLDPSKLAAAGFFISRTPVIFASGIAMQFEAKPLFSDVSVKVGGGEVEPSAGSVGIECN